jgi:hypothetical protein
MEDLRIPAPKITGGLHRLTGQRGADRMRPTGMASLLVKLITLTVYLASDWA